MNPRDSKLTFEINVPVIQNYIFLMVPEDNTRTTLNWGQSIRKHFDQEVVLYTEKSIPVLI